MVVAVSIFWSMALPIGNISAITSLTTNSPIIFHSILYYISFFITEMNKFFQIIHFYLIFIEKNKYIILIEKQ
jgi:hypothetical protein